MIISYNPPHNGDVLVEAGEKQRDLARRGVHVLGCVLGDASLEIMKCIITFRPLLNAIMEVSIRKWKVLKSQKTPKEIKEPKRIHKEHQKAKLLE